jgi:hypothetical protein
MNSRTRPGTGFRSFSQPSRNLAHVHLKAITISTHGGLAHLEQQSPSTGSLRVDRGDAHDGGRRRFVPGCTWSRPTAFGHPCTAQSRASSVRYLCRSPMRTDERMIITKGLWSTSRTCRLPRRGAARLRARDDPRHVDLDIHRPGSSLLQAHDEGPDVPLGGCRQERLEELKGGDKRGSVSQEKDGNVTEQSWTPTTRELRPMDPKRTLSSSVDVPASAATTVLGVMPVPAVERSPPTESLPGAGHEGFAPCGHRERTSYQH